MSLAALRQRIADIVDPPREDPGLPTGIDALDRVLSRGGVPRGRLTEVVGARGAGRTTLLRRLVERAVGERLWVAYVDAARTLAPADWAEVGARGGVWVVRPPDPSRAAWCADLLLRTGAFALVVLDGAPALSRAVAVRLTRLAREGDAALVVVPDPDERGASAGAMVGGALRLRVERRAPAPRVARPPGAAAGARARIAWRPPSPHAPSPHAPGVIAGRAEGGPAKGQHRGRGIGRRVVAVTVEKGGPHHTVEVHCAVAVARRLCADPEVPDRRGVARRAARRR